MKQCRPGACSAESDKSSDKSNAAPGGKPLDKATETGERRASSRSRQRMEGRKTEKYTYEAVREIPHFTEKSGAYISLLRRFLKDQNAQTVRIRQTNARNINRIYHGFYSAVQRHRLGGELEVRRLGDELYIMKIGEKENEGN